MQLSLLSSVLALACFSSAMPSQAELGHLALRAPSSHSHHGRGKKPASSKSSAHAQHKVRTLSGGKTVKGSSSRSSSSYQPITGSYYADWTGDTFPPESVDFSKFDLVYFAFAIPDQSGNLYWTQDDSESLLSRVVSQGHAAGAKVIVSCGGWTGSTYFSKIVRTSSGRQKLASSMKSLITKFNLDGVDIDWEYPGSQGNNNIVSGDDSANLAIFLKLLRSTIGSNKLITMATSQQPFAGPDGNPLPSVASQAKYIDHILIMNYDVYASSSTPGPNAPLSDGCNNSAYPFANAVAAIAAWEAAGMKASQLVLGLPAYGYVSQSTAKTLVEKRGLLKDQFWEGQKRGAERRLRARQASVAASSATAPSPTSTGLTPTVKACPFDHGGFGCADTQPSFSAPAPPSPSSIIFSSGTGDLSSFMGQQIDFTDIVQLGALALSSTQKSNLKTFTSMFVGHAGYTRYWDKCSNTPYLVNEIRSTVVTYDDDVSIQLKAAYAASKQIAGIGFWSMDGDTSKYALVCAARAGLGRPC